MTKPSLPSSVRSKRSRKVAVTKESKSHRTVRRRQSHSENTHVLVSAVISPYLLTHLHHVLQRAEYWATQDGRTAQAANFAQLRKVLCMDARSMKDASAIGLRDSDIEKFHDLGIGSKVA